MPFSKFSFKFTIKYKTMNNKIKLTALVIAFSSFAFSQITQGKISYDVYASSDNPQMASYIEQMGDSQLDIVFTDEKTRSEMNLGGMSNNITINDKATGTSLVLMDNMYMGKIAMNLTKEEQEESRDSEQAKMYQVEEVTLVEGETKEILGHQCKKAILYMEGGNETVVWYTEDIVPSYRNDAYLFEEVPGLPMEMTSKSYGMDMKIVAYSFTDKLKKKKLDKLFSMEIPNGFTVKTLEEMKKFGGGK